MGLLPTLRYKRVYDIPLEKLKELEILLVLLDMDNTTAPWRTDIVAPEIAAYSGGCGQQLVLHGEIVCPHLEVGVYQLCLRQEAQGQVRVIFQQCHCAAYIHNVKIGIDFHIAVPLDHIL